MIGLIFLLAATQPESSAELVLSQLETIRDSLSAGEAKQLDQKTREERLIGALDEATLALYEARKALELVEGRLAETTHAIAIEKSKELAAQKNVTAAAEQARHALGYLVRRRHGLQHQPMLKAIDRRRVTLALERLGVAEHRRKQLADVQARLAAGLAKQESQQRDLQSLASSRKLLERAASDALEAARRDEKRAREHSLALERNRLALAAWLERLKPVLNEPVQEGPPRRGRLLAPAPGWLRHGYGLQEGAQGLSRWRNRGIDIKSPESAPAVAASAGTVAFVGRSPGLGLVVVMDHGAGWRTVYGGLGEAKVQTGDKLNAGAALGNVGSGGHLHFELRLQTQSVNPEAWFREPIPGMPK